MTPVLALAAGVVGVLVVTAIVAARALPRGDGDVGPTASVSCDDRTRPSARPDGGQHDPP